MKKIILSFVAVLAALTVSAQSNLSETYTRAVEAFNAKDYPAAASNFEKIIDLAGDSSDVEEQEWVGTSKQFLPRAYFMMGGAAVQQGDNDTALQHFSRSAELAELYGNLQQANQSKQWVANVYMKQAGDAFNAKDYATAIAIYMKGYEADPRNTQMALNLAMSHAELGMAGLDWVEYAKAMRVYSAVATLDNPKFADDAAIARDRIVAYTNNMVIQMQTLFAQKNYADLLSHAEAAETTLTDETALSNVYFLVGATHNALDQKAQAIAAFRKVTAGPNVSAARQAADQLAKQ